MKVLKLKYNDGTSCDIENADCVIDLGDGGIAFFMAEGFTKYYADNVLSYELAYCNPTKAAEK